jgi:DNA-binding CsgD family transcriptional regulator
VIALVDGLPELGSRVSYQLRSGPIGAFEQSVLDRLDRPHVAPSGIGNSDLVVPLTDREQTILRYLSSRLTLKEIASECYVSPNTVKTQSQAVYRKLGVSTRNEAIIEGRRLRLI